MSVLIKRTDVIGGNSSLEGYPAGNVTDVKIGCFGSITINFSDPNDVTIGNTTFHWYETVLVRKENTPPLSIKDGDIVLDNIYRNQYVNKSFKDTTAKNGKTYYYRFFTTTGNNIYNNDSSMIYKASIINASSILSENSWDTISKISEMRMASSIWNIGDEIDITYKNGITTTLQIWDFDHFDKTDGSGKAGICFGTKYLHNGLYGVYNENLHSYWLDSSAKNVYLPNAFETLPDELQNVVKEVYTYSIESPGSSEIDESKDKLFYPGSYELGLGNDLGQKRFPIFTDNNSRICKKDVSGHSLESNYASYWSRSPHINSYRCIGGVGALTGEYYILNINNGANQYSRFCFNV